MSDIKKLLQKRDTLFQEQSKNIMTHLDFVTEGIKTFLCDIDPGYEPGTFQWEDVSIYTEPGKGDDLLMLIGIVTYDIGTQLMMNDQMIIVDEENQDYFSRVLRMGIPFSVVDKDSPAAVVDFLSKLNTAVSRQDVTQADDEPAPKQEEPKKVPVKKGKPSKSKHDFDLDELSDKQLESLRLYNLTNK